MDLKKIVFLTGTRADFGKLKCLMQAVQSSSEFRGHIFVTGMHMSRKYGYTVNEVYRAGLENVYTFINHNELDLQDTILAKTISGFSDYVREIQPDMIIIHGDRPEALAGAIVGCFNNYLVAHIEGGEVSGTIDEFIRHAVSKLSHLHFVANEAARDRLRQMGEPGANVYIVGSPDIDIMLSDNLPTIDQVKERYDIFFDDYGIVLFHPVTTERDSLKLQADLLVDALLETELCYVVIGPNNDPGNNDIFDSYEKIKSNHRFRFLLSMRFEYFLSLLKHARFIIGNSSAGIREAPAYGIPTINIGSRQKNRAKLDSIIHSDPDFGSISEAIEKAQHLSVSPTNFFGRGNSCEKFMNIICSESFWKTAKQKVFIDRRHLI